MRYCKTLLSFLIILFPIVINGSVCAEPRTLQTFGVQVKHGQPVYPLPSNVALGLFNPDPLLDLAYYHEGKVQVWQNLGNGTFGSEPVWERVSNGVVEKLEWRKSNMFNEMILDHTGWGDLLATFADGRTEKISHEQMLNAKTSFASPPQKPNSFPLIDFREVWRSQTQTQPTRFMTTSRLLKNAI